MRNTKGLLKYSELRLRVACGGRWMLTCLPGCELRGAWNFRLRSAPVPLIKTREKLPFEYISHARITRTQ